MNVPNSDDRWFVVGVNAEPWAIGPITVGRKGKGHFPIVGRNQKLASYQEALAAELEGAGILEGEVEITLFIWRRLDNGLSFDGKKHRAHQADATNIQKATEDAIQGVLIQNDRNVRKVTTEIVEQNATVEPCVAIRTRPYEPFDPANVPEFIWPAIDRLQGVDVQPELIPDWYDESSNPLADIKQSVKESYENGYMYPFKKVEDVF